MIPRLIEGELVPVACNMPCCVHCATLDVWEQLKDAIDGVVDSITADLADKQKAKLA